MHLEAQILEMHAITNDVYSMTLQCPGVADSAQPGQFVHVAVAQPGSTDPLLRRPLSICDADRSKGTVELVFRIVGRGTRLLAGRQASERIDLMGPIGTGFRRPRPGRVPLVVAGGIGIAPLHFLCRALLSVGVSPYVIAGFSTRSDMILVDRLVRYGAKVQVITEDGSFGLAGKVTEYIERAAQEINSHSHGEVELYACGPLGMINSVRKWCLETGVFGQVSLESRMACGTGACLGCVLRVITASGEERYERVCVDGPVFDVRRIVTC